MLEIKTVSSVGSGNLLNPCVLVSKSTGSFAHYLRAFPINVSLETVSSKKSLELEQISTEFDIFTDYRLQKAVFAL